MSRHSTAWEPSSDEGAAARGFNPPRTHRLWRDVLLPRVTYPLLWLAWIALLPAAWFRPARRGGPSCVAVESGRIGWTHVFYEELWASLGEYVGSGDRLVRVEIDRDQPYAPQCRAWVDDPRLTHAVVDLRTGPQQWPAALRTALVLAWRFRRRRITPVVVLTDASLRRHRAQAAVITAVSGVVVTFMSAALVSGMFPHRRIIGPLPMPVSVARLEWLDRLHRPDPDAGAPRVSFIGSVYPPRSVFLERLGAALAERGIALEVRADKYGTSNEDYWRVLASSGIIVTTTLQGMPRPSMDWIWIEQLVFRFSEALSARAVLVAPEVAGAARLFRPGEDFVPFMGLEEAVEVIAGLVGDPARRAALARHGHATATRLARGHAFWSAIDEELGDQALVAGRSR